MTQVHRAIPWAASVAVHVVLLLIPLRIVWQPLIQRSVEIDLSLQAASTPRGHPGQTHGSGFPSTSASGPVAARTATPAKTPSEMPAAHPLETRPAAQPPTAQPPAISVAPPAAASNPLAPPPVVVSPVRQSPTQTAPPVDTPSAADVLADLASAPGAASAPPAAGSAASSGTQSDGLQLPGSGGVPQSQIAWEKDARTLVRRPGLQFPAALSAAGQEVECEAQIAVSPTGAVTHVEIIRSSGYTDIDESVVAALWGYRFSPVESRKDAVGTVRFRFRLEKRD